MQACPRFTPEEKRKHKIECSKEDRRAANTPSSSLEPSSSELAVSTPVRQGPMQTSLFSFLPKPVDANTKKKIDEELVKFVVNTNSPLNITEDPFLPTFIRCEGLNHPMFVNMQYDNLVYNESIFTMDQLASLTCTQAYVANRYSVDLERQSSDKRFRCLKGMHKRYLWTMMRGMKDASKQRFSQSRLRKTVV